MFPLYFCIKSVIIWKVWAREDFHPTLCKKIALLDIQSTLTLRLARLSKIGHRKWQRPRFFAKIRLG